MDKTHKEDSVGKLYFDYKESLKTIRKFKSYTVSSLVSSKRFPDLSGYFLKIDNLNRKKIIDVFDSKCSHYLVTGGKIKFYIFFLKIEEFQKKKKNYFLHQKCPF